MIVVIQDSSGCVALRVESDGNGRYKISGPNLPRQDGRMEYETDDGFHVLGLIQLVFGANDSLEYLKRRLAEHDLTNEFPSATMDADHPTERKLT
jgi:hypothetical protein